MNRKTKLITAAVVGLLCLGAPQLISSGGQSPQETPVEGLNQRSGATKTAAPGVVGEVAVGVASKVIPKSPSAAPVAKPERELPSGKDEDDDGYDREVIVINIPARPEYKDFADFYAQQHAKDRSRMERVFGGDLLQLGAADLNEFTLERLLGCAVRTGPPLPKVKEGYYRSMGVRNCEQVIQVKNGRYRERRICYKQTPDYHDNDSIGSIKQAEEILLGASSGSIEISNNQIIFKQESEQSFCDGIDTAGLSGTPLPFSGYKTPREADSPYLQRSKSFDDTDYSYGRYGYGDVIIGGLNFSYYLLDAMKEVMATNPGEVNQEQYDMIQEQLKEWESPPKQTPEGCLGYRYSEIFSECNMY